MHLVIDHASPPGPHCQAALSTLQLPALAQLLKFLSPAEQCSGTAQDLTPLSEHVRAHDLGMDGADGLIPWAAADAHRLGLHRAVGTGAWAWITPCHWQVNANHVEMLDVNDLALTQTETATLMDAMRAYFSEDGITLHPLTPGTWLAQGAVFDNLATASLGRASGARIDSWMPRQPPAKALRRLQNEMQMLLYTHPINDARAARGQTTVNSFWVSGTGELPEPYEPVQAPRKTQLETSLRAAALRDDASAWLQAWKQLDRTLLAGVDTKNFQLTLCGEQRAITYAPAKGSWITQLRQRFAAPNPIQVLSTL